jgi:lipopolysaccharide/colanic/teichoic acid biosynthesis glycosyltransferase
LSFKRSFDIIFSLLSLILLTPILILIVILVKCSSKGPVLYKGIRTGYKGEKFEIIKFRTMVYNAEAIGGPSTGVNDPRITEIGTFLRKYKLDELPQFINVLIGEMSIVGPRPEVPTYTSWYRGEEKIILSVKPGITDYSSIKFNQLQDHLGEDEPDAVYEKKVRPIKNKLRVKYVKERGFITDLKILYMTITTILLKKSWNIEN